MKHLQNHKSWLDVRGDDTLALDWPLDTLSLVWEIGGYEGRWIRQIDDKFHCYIVAFEPQDWAYKKLIREFGEKFNISIQPYGLWVEEATLPIGSFFTDGASVIKTGDGDPEHVGEFKDIVEELRETGLVDVCLMNVEGAEYSLIPCLIEHGEMGMIQYFWCQFHPGLIDDPEKRIEDIFAKMEETHELLWNCYPTAVAWRRKNDAQTMDLSAAFFAKPVLEVAEA